jgi:hypothetical protein
MSGARSSTAISRKIPQGCVSITRAGTLKPDLRVAKRLVVSDAGVLDQFNRGTVGAVVASNFRETVHRIKGSLAMKTIEARITKNIKEDPSIEECDIWNIQATFLDPLPSDATRITADPIEIGVKQIEAARTDRTRTEITIRTQQKSRLQPGEMIHLGFEQDRSPIASENR